MGRKRIVWCQDPSGTAEALTARYFGAGQHRLIRLSLKEAVPEPASVSSLVVANTSDRLSSASSKLGTDSSGSGGVSVRKLCREARFSDLLVMTDTHYRQFDRSRKATRLTPSSPFACPVLVAPEQEERIEQLILIDDGQPNTRRQIKYVAGLFAELCSAVPTTLLNIHDGTQRISAREEKLWIEYLRLHFASLAVHRIKDQFTEAWSFLTDCYQNALPIGSCRATAMPTAPLESLKQFRLIL